MPPCSIAVIGGGPAGAMAAASLAAAGHTVWLAEEKPGWEKPCGGGVTAKAQTQYPFLCDGDAAASNPVRECILTSPAGRTVVLPLDHQVAIFARRDLNRFLLARARAAGAEIIADRVIEVVPDTAGWRLSLRGGAARSADAVVIAAGARAPWRDRFPCALGPADWMATAGYYIPLARLPWPPPRMVIRFLSGVEGYIWSFPRGDHASVGICGRMGTQPTAALRRHLEQWLAAEGVAFAGCSFYAHLLPAPSPAALACAQFAGAAPAPWALAGDAAGLVDPITGEGLYYALRSGELLGEAWRARPDPDGYQGAVARELVPELTAAARIAPRFYAGRFLCAPVLERMAQFTRRSPRFRSLMCDLFSGAQGYSGLRARLWRQLIPSLCQAAFPSQ